MFFKYVSLKIVSAYIFHILSNLICDLCACTGAYVSKNVSAYIFSHSVHQWTKIDTDWTKWTELDKSGQTMDKNLSPIGQILTESGQIWTKLDKRWTNGQIWTTVDKSRNPLIRLSFRLFCPLFLSNLDKLVDKNSGNP